MDPETGKGINSPGSNSKDESLTGYMDDCGGWEESKSASRHPSMKTMDADGVVHNVVAEPFDHSEASRCYSSFNCGHDDEQKGEVNSNSRHVRASVIEDSMRKFCEDRSYHMFKPEVGVKFESLEDAYQFYNMYSWVTGFSIKCGDNYTNGRRVKTMQEYKCQREGFTKAAKMSTTRCGYKAMVRLAMADSVNTSSWYVRAFVEEHNHELVDSCGEKKLLSSLRNTDKHIKEIVKHLRENNVTLSRVNCILGSFFGSMDKVPIDKKSLRTVCSNIASDALRDDMRKTMENFRSMISNDPRFVFTAQLDEEDMLKSLMWTSSRSRSMNRYFGDVVTFDTTYKTNIYKMPFGMFVGVDNHFQSVIFAGVLLTNETVEDFTWAFTEFVVMMDGKPPTTILTDQCLAMTSAIRECLKDTTHMWLLKHKHVTVYPRCRG